MLRVTHLALNRNLWNYIIKHSIKLSVLLIAVFLGIAIISKAQNHVPRYEVGISQNYIRFNEIFKSQYATTVVGSVLHEYGKYSLKISRGDRFQISGYQFEAEAYPVFSKKLYGYVAYAWSNSSIFPNHRLGGELFVAMPKAFEVSLGARYLNIQTNVSSQILTGSISKYYKAYLFSVRPFFVFSGGGTGQTLVLSAKRYFNDEGDVVGIRVGGGVSPDQILYQLGGGEIGNRLLLLKSRQMGVEAAFNINQKWLLAGSVDYLFQELAFRLGDFVRSIVVGAGVSRKF